MHAGRMVERLAKQLASCWLACLFGEWYLTRLLVVVKCVWDCFLNGRHAGAARGLLAGRGRVQASV